MPSSGCAQRQMDPRQISQGSNMPSYHWLASNQVDMPEVPRKMATLKSLGVPYSDDQIGDAVAAYETQARAFLDELAALASSRVEDGTIWFGVQPDLEGAALAQAKEKCETKLSWDSEMIALIAYLQRLGDNDLDLELASK